MFSGHLPADPNASMAADNDVTSHLFFVLVKNRRTADKERIIFWFNASAVYISVVIVPFNNRSISGGSRMLIIRRVNDGDWTLAGRWERRPEDDGRWMGRVHDDGLRFV